MYSFRLAALLHDAPEYVIGDMISPFKAVLGGDYKAVEKRLLAAIHIRFGLPPVLSTRSRGRSRQPTRARPISRRPACGLCAKPRRNACSGAIPACRLRAQEYLTPWTAAKAEKRFLARFKALTAYADLAVKTMPGRQTRLCPPYDYII